MKHSGPSRKGEKMSVRTRETSGMLPLSQSEIDRRIGDLSSNVLSAVGDDPVGSEPSRPRWISPAELVERVRPFLGHN